LVRDSHGKPNNVAFFTFTSPSGARYSISQTHHRSTWGEVALGFGPKGERLAVKRLFLEKKPRGDGEMESAPRNITPGDRALREVALHKTVDPKAIVETFTYDGEQWIVMAYRPTHAAQFADNLDANLRNAQMPRSIRKLARARQMLAWGRAVDAVHTAGIAHFDVKSENMLVDENGHMHLIDFGCAQRINMTTQSVKPDGAGTPDYAAPEIVRGRSDRRLEAGRAADIWSLGTMVFDLHTHPELLPFRHLPTEEDAAVWVLAKWHTQFAAWRATLLAPTALDGGGTQGQIDLAKIDPEDGGFGTAFEEFAHREERVVQFMLEHLWQQAPERRATAAQYVATLETLYATLRQQVAAETEGSKRLRKFDALWQQSAEPSKDDKKIFAAGRTYQDAATQLHAETAAQTGAQP
jgi:hypothetical protein